MVLTSFEVWLEFFACSHLVVSDTFGCSTLFDAVVEVESAGADLPPARVARPTSSASARVSEEDDLWRLWGNPAELLADLFCDHPALLFGDLIRDNDSMHVVDDPANWLYDLPLEIGRGRCAVLDVEALAFPPRSLVKEDRFGVCGSASVGADNHEARVCPNVPERGHEI